MTQRTREEDETVEQDGDQPADGPDGAAPDGTGDRNAGSERTAPEEGRAERRTVRDDATHLADIDDGCGCAEVWEHLSERRAADSD